MSVIYRPCGMAREYSPFALNIKFLPEEKNPDQYIVRVLDERKQASLFDGDLK